MKGSRHPLGVCNIVESIWPSEVLSAARPRRCRRPNLDVYLNEPVVARLVRVCCRERGAPIATRTLPRWSALVDL